MKSIRNIFFLLLLFIVSRAGAQDIPAKPEPQKLVNDYTNTLTIDQQQALERKLYTFDDSTTSQIVVVIVPSTDGTEVTDFATELGRKWGVGDKKNNNGVVLLIAKNDRKLSIAPGYGLEGALPDAVCNEIIQGIIVPRFKGNDYYDGIDEGVDAIINAIKGVYKAPPGYHKSGKGSSLGRIILIIAIIIIFLAITGGGKGGGTFMSRRGYRGYTGPTIWWTGGGGSSGGGGWSGGGGSSGGFGGFGGGSFGGGGSSGSW